MQKSMKKHPTPDTTSIETPPHHAYQILHSCAPKILIRPQKIPRAKKNGHPMMLKRHLPHHQLARLAAAYRLHMPLVSIWCMHACIYIYIKKICISIYIYIHVYAHIYWLYRYVCVRTYTVHIYIYTMRVHGIRDWFGHVLWLHFWGRKPTPWSAHGGIAVWRFANDGSHRRTGKPWVQAVIFLLGN